MQGMHAPPRAFLLDLASEICVVAVLLVDSRTERSIRGSWLYLVKSHHDRDALVYGIRWCQVRYVVATQLTGRAVKPGHLGRN
jgi:hypothetical protein